MSTQQLVGRIVGSYRVEQVLSSGEMSSVYLARHLERNYPVTITMYLLPDTLSKEARGRFMARFAQVGATLVTLRHHHLVPTYGYGEHFGSPYIVTGSSRGESLAQMLKRHDPCTPRFTLQVLKQIAEGLEYAHSHGIVHRALRPDHILFAPTQTVQVAGCGLTQLLALQGTEQSNHPYAHLLTIAGAFLGAPESIAPECIRGHAADRRADVYGLGILLFELLSGKPPLSGADPFLTAMQHLQRPLPSLHALRPDLPREIDQVILHATSRDPARRYQRVSDLVVAYSRVLTYQEGHASPVKAPGSRSGETSPSGHRREEATGSTGKWQLVPPIVTGALPALGTQEATAVPMPSSVQGPTEAGMPVQQKRHVPPVKAPGPRSGETSPPVHRREEATGSTGKWQLVPPIVTGALPALGTQGATSVPMPSSAQAPKPVHVPDQPEKVTDPIPMSALTTSAADPAESDAGTSHSLLLDAIQLGLVGLIYGSVLTLAPIFATAFATHRSLTTFLVGMASATGAGICMAFAEALSDDGELTGRGNAMIHGGTIGLMTFLSGAWSALPFLIPDIHLALLFGYVFVAIELIAVAVIRYRFFKTSWWLAIIQVVGGGLLVFVAALLFGNA